MPRSPLAAPLRGPGAPCPWAQPHWTPAIIWSLPGGRRGAPLPGGVGAPPTVRRPVGLCWSPGLPSPREGVGGRLERRRVRPLCGSARKNARAARGVRATRRRPGPARALREPVPWESGETWLPRSKAPFLFSAKAPKGRWRGTVAGVFPGRGGLLRLTPMPASLTQKGPGLTHSEATKASSWPYAGRPSGSMAQSSGTNLGRGPASLAPWGQFPSHFAQPEGRGTEKTTHHPCVPITRQVTGLFCCRIRPVGAT